MFFPFELVLRTRIKQLYNFGNEVGVVDLEEIPNFSVDGQPFLECLARQLSSAYPKAPSFRGLLIQYKAYFYEPINELFVFWFENGNFF